jgi:hypothetical protein
MVEELKKLDDRGAIEKGHSSHDSYDFNERSGGSFGCMHVSGKLFSDVGCALYVDHRTVRTGEFTVSIRTLRISVPKQD